MIHDTLIRGFGKLYITSHLKDGESTRVTHDFLGSLVERCLRQSLYYFEETRDDLPFLYNERQLHSIIAPAIADLTSTFLMEAPVKRKRKDHDSDALEEGAGRVDYWCDYRGFTFFLEFKHGYFSPVSMKIRSSLQKNWEKANIQLKEVKSEIKDWISSGGARRIAIAFVPFYKTAHPDQDTHVDSKSIFKCHNILQEKLDPQPNWSALCLINDEINEKPFEYDNDRYEIYPAVGIYCRVFPYQQG